MTERNVSREQSIALHLARVMGLETWEVRTHPRSAPVTKHHFTREGETHEWHPHHDRAQWAEVILWAAVNRLNPLFSEDYEVCMWPNGKTGIVQVKHDNTHAGVRAAALEAIALATGWPGMEG